METTIDVYGCLKITAESSFEAYVLKLWENDNISLLCDMDLHIDYMDYCMED